MSKLFSRINLNIFLFFEKCCKCCITSYKLRAIAIAIKRWNTFECCLFCNQTIAIIQWKCYLSMFLCFVPVFFFAAGDSLFGIFFAASFCFEGYSNKHIISGNQNDIISKLVNTSQLFPPNSIPINLDQFPCG